MKGIVNNCMLSDLCQIIGAKSFTLPVLSNGGIKTTLYVPNKYDIGSPFSFFVTEQKKNGYYLLSEHTPDLLYCSFVLNSGVGLLYMHEGGDSSYTKGTVTKRKLENVSIKQLSDNYKMACNILEMIIIRVSHLQVKEETEVIRNAAVSFLKEMRGYIGMEIYMNEVFEDRNVSILKPWTVFVEERGASYKLKQIDEVFISFYKSISDPENDLMDAMKKARLFVWTETINK